MVRLVILILIEILAISLLVQTAGYLLSAPQSAQLALAALIGLYIAVLSILFATLKILQSIE